MRNKNRVVRALAGLVALGAVGGLSAGAVPQLATADTQAKDHLSSAALLTAGDVRDAGWKGALVSPTETDYGALLGQCAGPTPNLVAGFLDMKGADFTAVDPNVSAGGIELVLHFRTSADARYYVEAYRTALEYRCLDGYGPKAWHVTRSAKVGLRSSHEHARAWTVKDKTNKEQTLSVTMVRVGDQVALLWFTGYPKDPAKTINLHRLTQQAADRMEA